MLAMSEMGMGRGWQNVNRSGREVTQEVLIEARDDTAELPTADDFKAEIAARSAAGPIRIAGLVELAAEWYPQSRVSERIALSDETLRAVGLSRAKVLSLRDLAAKVLDGTVVLSPRGLARESDEEIIARLSPVRGIGTWTAEMFLLFQLRRLDVWPVGDLGVRRGYGLAWQVPTPTVRELQPLGDPYRPYRSVLAWYCWRAAELYAGAAESALTR